MESLPNELVDDIVSRLPVTDLRSVRNVSHELSSHALPRMTRAKEEAYRHDVALVKDMELVSLYSYPSRFESLRRSLARYRNVPGNRLEDTKRALVRRGIINDAFVPDLRVLNNILNERFRYFSRIVVTGTFMMIAEQDEDETYDGEDIMEEVEKSAEIDGHPSVREVLTRIEMGFPNIPREGVHLRHQIRGDALYLSFHTSLML